MIHSQIDTRSADFAANAAAMREKEFGIWQTLTWSQIATVVEHIACGLHQLGLRRGEHMVIIGANRPRLYATMLAAQSVGAIPVPLEVREHTGTEGQHTKDIVDAWASSVDCAVVGLAN